MLAVGLLIGLLVVKRRPDAETSSASDGYDDRRRALVMSG